MQVLIKANRHDANFRKAVDAHMHVCISHIAYITCLMLHMCVCYISHKSHTSYYACVYHIPHITRLLYNSQPAAISPPGHVWQRLETFLAVITRMCYWHLGIRRDAARNPTVCGTASHKVPVIRPKISTVLRRRKRDPYGHTEENMQTEHALSTARGTRLLRARTLWRPCPVSH